MKRLILALLGCAACAPKDVCGPDACPWAQWAGGPAHQGTTCAAGQGLGRILADVVIDPFASEEAAADPRGDLSVHFQAPLVECDDVFVEIKSGSKDAQVWSERRYRWSRGKLEERWTFTSDWKPLPADEQPLFQPALAGGFIYVPGAGGTLHQLDRESGDEVSVIDPFGSDPSMFVSGGLAVDGSGALYYDAIKVDPKAPWASDATGWLIKIDPSGDLTRVRYASLVLDAPAPTDDCVTQFPATTPPPLPPSPTAVAPTVACGSQRPALNVTPAIGADGTVFVLSRAHRAPNYSYLVALDPDLAPKWARSLRGLINDGCGVTVGCSPGAQSGVDPDTNLPPALSGDDDSSSSPVALPDGSVVYGAYSQYNDYRGHLVKLGTDGAFLASYDFGWDLTPAVVTHDSTYSLILKDNHYDQGDGFFITQLDANLAPEWKLANPTRDAAHPRGYEWCVNAPAVDKNGTIYSTSEDGNLYAIPKGGGAPRVFPIGMPAGAAYTPMVLDSAGRIYALNGGHLLVIGN